MAYTLDKFFCCLELQIGGIICAWWGMIASALSIVSLIITLIFGGSDNFGRFFPFRIGHTGSLISVIIVILILLVYFYFSYQLLLGTQNGNSSQMFGYLIINGILVVIFIIGVFGNASSLLLAILYAYLWYCIYSLYVRTGGTGIV